VHHPLSSRFVQALILVTCFSPSSRRCRNHAAHTPAGATKIAAASGAG
jgi:hypothetical protein